MKKIREREGQILGQPCWRRRSSTTTKKIITVMGSMSLSSRSTNQQQSGTVGVNNNVRFKIMLLLFLFVGLITLPVEQGKISIVMSSSESIINSTDIKSTSPLSNNNKMVPQFVKEGHGGIFFCGYENVKFAEEVFPDYMWRYKGGLDDETHQILQLKRSNKRMPNKDDILVFGLHGPCTADIHNFPGKVLFVNGEPEFSNMPETVSLQGRPVGQDVYQIGLLPDSPHSVMIYHGAWNMMRLDENVYSTLWDHSRKPINSGKYNGLMYMSKNCRPHREEAVHQISNLMTIYHGGDCKGLRKHEQDTKNFKRMPTIPSKRFWIYNRDAYSDYKFCMAMENSLTPHYMSEKIIMAFLAGCIPIYYGSQEVFDVFNQKAFVFYDPRNSTPALQQVELLLSNETAYHDMLHNEPILANGEQTVRDYFSVSDRIGGGYLKNKLRKTMGLPVP